MRVPNEIVTRVCERLDVQDFDWVAACTEVYLDVVESPPRPEPVAWAKVQRVAANIRSNLDSLTSIASVWADDLDEALAHPSVPPHRVMRVCLKEVE